MARCSRWLVFVEGVGQAGRKMPEYFWGENLSGVRRKPLRVGLSGKLVYSPHLYGPGLVQYMHYFRSAGFPSAMPHVWHEHFGFLLGRRDVTVVVGEWGGPLASEADERWQRELVDYLEEQVTKGCLLGGPPAAEETTREQLLRPCNTDTLRNEDIADLDGCLPSQQQLERISKIRRIQPGGLR